MNCMYRTLLATVALAFSSVTASAETITVCASGCDYTAIQEAIDAASAGDIISVSAGTYELDSALSTKGKALILQGATSKTGLPLAILDGGKSTRHFWFDDGEGYSTEIRSFILRNGRGESFYLPCCNRAPRGGSVVCLFGSQPLFHECFFIDNQTAGPGGAVYVYQSDPRFERCLFTNNAAASSGGGSEGGGIDSYDGNAVVSDSGFCGNSPDDISGVWGNDGGNFFPGDCSDCDLDGVFNSAAIAFGISIDCDGDTIPDTCAVADGSRPDCDGNGVPDQCDIESGDAADDDEDGTPNECDECPSDPLKTLPGQCGCGVPDTDSDGDGVANCVECPTDINNDGVVGPADLGILLAVWGTDGGGIDGADNNGDGTVNASDLGLLLGAWGPCP